MPSVITGIGSGVSSPPTASSTSILPSSSPTPTPAAPPIPKPVKQRDFTDIKQIRNNIYDRVYDSVNNIGKLQNALRTLEIKDLKYVDPPDIPIHKQKEAILTGKSLHRRLRGTWRLTDNATNTVLDEKPMTVAQVPYMSPRGTFVINGTEYSLANQTRLRPGVFTRIKENGELESHINVMPGNGITHRYFLDPATGVFKINIGQAKLPLYPVLKSIGIKDSELRKAWGTDLLAVNQQISDNKAVHKLYQRLIRNPNPELPPEQKGEALGALFASMKLDPEVTSHTLGKPYEFLTKEAMIDATKKLAAVSRKEQEPDDRDHMAYQVLYAPEDLLSERITKDKAFLRNILFKVTYGGNLRSIQPGVLTKQLRSVILGTGLGQASEQINPSEILDSLSRTTRLGVGGIASADAVPDSSRSVNSSHFGYIDPIRTPESNKVGIDSRIAYTVKKGDDGKLYSPFINTKTNKLEYKAPQDVANLTIAFPGELAKNKPYVAAMSKGETRFVDRDKVDYELPHMEHAFSHLSNMIPMKSAMKGQRLSMGARFLAQSLSLTQREAPYVQSAIPGQHMNRSFEEEYGKYLGAVHANKPGVIQNVTPDNITIRYDDGTTEDHELYNHMPFARKTFYHNTALVAPGDKVQQGQIIAKSNYTDDKGTSALGINARVALLNWRGLNYEDAGLSSESFAKKLTSEHMYQHAHDWSDNTKKGLKPFISLFPTAYDKAQLANMDEHGVIKPGTVLKYNDPIILVAEERERTQSKIHKGHKPSYANKTLTWDHKSPGIVTDVAHTLKGVNVAIKSYAPMQVGDKFCFSSDTEILTKQGWRLASEVTLEDEVATLTPEKGFLEFQKPTELVSYDYQGEMFSIKTNLLNMLVTPEHKLWVSKFAYDFMEQDFKPITAKEFSTLSGKWNFKVDARWQGVYEERYEDLDMKLWLEFLGYYLANGYVKYNKIHIQLPELSPNIYKLISLLEKLNFSYIRKRDIINTFSITHTLSVKLKELGENYKRRIPNYVQELSPSLLKIFLDAFLMQDSNTVKTLKAIKVKSKQLCDDLSIIGLKLGLAVTYKAKANLIVFNTSNLRPQFTRGIAITNQSFYGWVNYTGKVYCLTVPNSVVYTRREGVTVWSHNSNRYGGKGVLADIIPDDQMPHDKDGKPFDMVATPLGILSRINGNSVIETTLGKIAEKTGVPYKIEDFANIKDLSEFARQELKKHNISPTETVIDPDTGREIPNIMTGNQYMLKLHHTSEAKSQGRGIGAYSAEGIPAKGGDAASKKIGMLDTLALLSHGATEVLRDAKLVRGQQNDEYWQAIMSGFRPPEPKVPLIYQKYVDSLKASGINVVRDGFQMHVLALTDKDVDKLAGDRELQNADTVDWKEGLKPKRGGLFDPTLTGGHGGNRFAAIKLHEPLPNPAFEEPIRKLLGITQNQFDDIIAGKGPLKGYGTGPAALKKALEDFNVPEAIKEAQGAVHGSKRVARDEAVRKLKYLKSLDRLNMHPKDWILHRVPVLPPIFRPVSVMQGSGGQLISDANYLYKELFDSNNLLKESMDVGLGEYSNERASVYNALKGVVGLGDPIQAKNRERGVQGLLKQVFGTGPKFSSMQSKILTSSVDTVGRSVITPDPNLDMDSVGLPEKKAMEVFKPHVIRRLVRAGVPRLEALRAVKDELPIAWKSLEEELKERPVFITRAPVLHRYGFMSAWAKLTKGDILRIPPIITKPMSADFDGDALNWHVPASEEAKKEAIEKMLPSRNLLSAADFKPVYAPQQEYQGGLYHASTAKKDVRPHVFRNKQDAIKAYKEGRISLDTPVEIIEH